MTDKIDIVIGLIIVLISSFIAVYFNFSGILNKLLEDQSKILEIINQPYKARELLGEILLMIKTENGNASGAKIIFNNAKWIVTNKHVVFGNYTQLFKDPQNVCRKKIKTVKDSNDTIIEIDEKEIYAHKTLDILIIKVKEPNGKFAEISSEDLKIYQVLYGKYSNIGSMGNVLSNHVDGHTYSNTPGYGGWSGSPLTDGIKLLAIHKGGGTNFKHDEFGNQLQSLEEINYDYDNDDDYEQSSKTLVEEEETQEIDDNEEAEEKDYYNFYDESDNIDTLNKKMTKTLNKIGNVIAKNSTIESKWNDFSLLIKKAFKIIYQKAQFYGRNPMSIIISSSKIFQIDLESGHVNVNTIPICSKKKKKESKSKKNK